ncbi:hypothetical protein B0H14DRAFT_2170018, partial [Mycena olivaceomarginata]
PDSFRMLKDLLKLNDGWRTILPDTEDYTCIQHRKNSQSNEIQDSYSRIDRICVVNKDFKLYRNWGIKPCAVKTDHRLVITQLTSRPDEQPGHRCWSMLLYLLETRKFMNYAQALAVQLLKDLECLEYSPHDEMENIQTLWAEWKLGIITYGKHCSRFI